MRSIFNLQKTLPDVPQPDWYTRLMAASRQLVPYLRNRYVLILLAVVVWMAFFDRYDWRTRAEMALRIHQLEADRDYYRHEIQRLKLERDQLQTNIQEVERIAREQYLMKRDNEDLFLVELDSTSR